MEQAGINTLVDAETICTYAAGPQVGLSETSQMRTGGVGLGGCLEHFCKGLSHVFTGFPPSDLLHRHALHLSLPQDNLAMSFGFGIGDFIAVGELCWKLYREVVEVSSGAPEELKSLEDELGSLSNLIKFLNEDLGNDESTIKRAGPNREKIAVDIMSQVNSILKTVQEFFAKFKALKLPQSGQRKERVCQSSVEQGEVRQGDSEHQ